MTPLKLDLEAAQDKVLSFLAEREQLAQEEALRQKEAKAQLILDQMDSSGVDADFFFFACCSRKGRVLSLPCHLRQVMNILSLQVPILLDWRCLKLPLSFHILRPVTVRSQN